jgi:glutamine cyclotransferase
MRPSGRTAIIAAIVLVLVVAMYFWQRPDRRGISGSKAPVFTYRVVNSYPHDSGAFTQGLVFSGGVMYEGTGLKGRSSLREVDLETGDVVRIHRLEDVYFGEGITVWEDTIVQLTLSSGRGFIYDAATFELLRDFTYTTGGWGITTDGERLIMSDGTSMLHFLDPHTFERVGQVIVKDGMRPVIGLNELEYINGEVFANVWQTDWIARISPATGKIDSWVDLSGLLPPEDRQGADVLNGIAYDAAGKRLFVTGKFWPRLFQIELVPK